MNLFYAVLSFVMVVYNCMQAFRGGAVMNYALAAMWLAIGVFCTVKHVKEQKNSKKKKETRQRGE